MSDDFLDVDFTTDPNYVFGDLGAPCFADMPSYEAALPNIPRDQIPGIVEKMEAEKSGPEWLVTRIYNQGREGSCVANACSQAHEILQAIQFGRDSVTHLSAISLYKRIGRSPGSGAMVSDGLEEMTRRGILPLDNEANRAKYGDAVMPATGFYEKFPANWEATAAKFRAVEALVVRSVDGLLSALCRQHPVVVGRAGHSICYVQPKIVNGRICVLYANSWGGGADGGGWGRGAGYMKTGFGIDSESYVRSSSSWAFALRSVTVPN